MNKLGNIIKTTPRLSKLVFLLIITLIISINYHPIISSNTNLFSFVDNPKNPPSQDLPNEDEILPLSASCPVTSLFTTTPRINVQAVMPNNTPKQTVLADFNKDGKLDIIACFPPFGIGVALGNGDGTFGAFTTVNPNLPTIQNMAVPDFNAATNLDVVFTQDTSPGTLVFLPGNGTNSFGTMRTFATGVTYHKQFFTNFFFYDSLTRFILTTATYLHSIVRLP